jgi:hypothetical protein
MPGKQYADTKISPRAKVEALSRDRDQAKKWLDSIPEVDTVANLKSYDEIEKLVNDWINGGSTGSDSGTSRGGNSSGSNSSSDSGNSRAVDKLAAFDEDEPRPPKKTGGDGKAAEKKLADAFADLDNDLF